MKQRYLTVILAAAGMAFAIATAWAAAPDANRGQQVFEACAACHSLEPNRSMTGPSLAGLWNRKAGSLASFPRYSTALKSSGIVWNDTTLDKWIKNPQQLIPDNDMPFQGIEDDRQRADLLAFLKQAAQSEHPPAQMGGMGGGEINLKTAGPEHLVRAVSYCRDTYRVTTSDGKTRAFWERNLRFKVDGSNGGPEKGVPGLVGAGSAGDRADVIFSSVEEISGFIKNDCGAQ